MWTSEVFSMNIRAQAVGMCSQMQNVANTIFQQFFPTFLANEGLKCLFFFFAMNIVLAVFVYFFIPETKKVALEEMDVLFGGANHVEKGSAVLGIGDGGNKTTPPATRTGAPAHEIMEKEEEAQVSQTEARREVV
jgi:hypothetical protein